MIFRQGTSKNDDRYKQTVILAPEGDTTRAVSPALTACYHTEEPVQGVADINKFTWTESRTSDNTVH